MRSPLVSVLSLLMVIVGSAILGAKGVTTRIEISGGDLAAPIEITDREILARFNVWAGAGAFMNGVEENEGFIIDWRAGVVAHPAGLRRYDVSFYVEYPSLQDENLAYVVSFAYERSTDDGYVYLPGSGDARYALNTRTIMRGSEGHWFRATRAWQHVARARLTPIAPPHQ